MNEAYSGKPEGAQVLEKLVIIAAVLAALGFGVPAAIGTVLGVPLENIF